MSKWTDRIRFHTVVNDINIVELKPESYVNKETGLVDQIRHAFIVVESDDFNKEKLSMRRLSAIIEAIYGDRDYTPEPYLYVHVFKSMKMFEEDIDDLPKLSALFTVLHERWYELKEEYRKEYD